MDARFVATDQCYIGIDKRMLERVRDLIQGFKDSSVRFEYLKRIPKNLF